MSAKAVKQTSENPRGLERAVATAPHSTMKRLGEVALLRGFSQEELARRLNDSFGLHLNGANVYGHITARRPQVETVRRYAKILGLDGEYRLLLPSAALKKKRSGKQARAVPADIDAFWLRQLALTFQNDEWEETASSAVTDCLRSLPPLRRRRILERIVFDSYREAHGATPGLASIALRLAFEKIAPPELKLQQHKRRRIPGEKSFVDLFNALGEILHDYPKEFDAVLTFVKALYLSHGIDITPMEAALPEDIPYRLWREGNLPKEDWQ